MESGVQGVRRVLAYSKKDLLLFKKMHIMGLQRQLSEATDGALVADCEFLTESGYLCSIPDSIFSFGRTAMARLESRYSSDSQADYDLWVESYARWVESGDDLSAFDDEPANSIAQMLRMASTAAHPRNAFTELPHGGEIVLAYVMTATGDRSIPILHSLPKGADWQLLEDAFHLPPAVMAPSPAHAVVELVLSNLPVPGDEVPLDSILAFSSDSETRRRLESLDLWMRGVGHSGKDLQAIALEMEQSLHEFSNHMQLADMRSKKSDLRIALSLPFGIIEELLHLRPKGALDVAFEYSNRRANRLEAEISAPGGALAYIYETEKRFAAGKSPRSDR